MMPANPPADCFERRSRPQVMLRLGGDEAVSG